MAGGGARLLLALEQGLRKRRGLVRVAHLALDALGGGGGAGQCRCQPNDGLRDGG
eukprot:CAMPEP_0185294558 /NCGR_PEP_ID=MMETSP1363-20130426/7695_1 /TAXON_ID=38817 /ORGANISM="Gephyrocapsa oceanica, Strain RCC1303" /LENGTH=54 /DNA_ID=CAMNT_0027891037 /DNA_START=612 /DNA_END=773 /DNA_ORIENTATION=+